MIKGYKKIKNKRAFTLIELIVTIAVLAILVLIAMPRLTGYTQKAELVRIQHDTKVMEQEMNRVILDNEVSLASWENSPKDLGFLVLKNELFDKEGFAERVDKSHLEKYYNREISVSNGSNELGVGGTEILLDNEEKEVGNGYKVIPDEYKSKIKTTLSGTFYTNELGKVYYGHDKPLPSQKDLLIKKCDSPVAADLGYTFNYETMTIEGYDDKEEHLVIPEVFKNPETDECVAVRTIDKGTFAIGGYKSVVIPESVHTIEDEAFLNNEFTEVYIPHSVERIGDNAFTGDYISSVTIGSSEGSVNIGNNAFLNRSTGVNIVPNHKIPSAKDLGHIFDVNREAIVSYSSSNKVLTIPSVVTVNGVEYEVKQIDKGAFQGLDLIAVVLPEGLERIEDYAFSGNQLIGITIPESVVHIGNYAFSFNEQTHSLTGKKRATIKTVMMYEGGQLVEQFGNINKHGDILESSGGPKVNLLDGRMTLLDHIFVTSIGNHVVDKEYGEAEDGKGEPGQQSGPITFYGPEEIFDDNLETYSSGNVEITWDGDLAHREISITSNSTYNSVTLTFIDENNKRINHVGENSQYKTIASKSKVTTKVIVPKGAVKMNMSSYNTSLRVYEITAPSTMERPDTQKITSTQTTNSVTLNWTRSSRAQIFKNGKKIGEVDNGTTYTDNALFPNEQQNYKVLFINENGNAPLDFVEYSVKTDSKEINFYSTHADGALMFDDDLNTVTSGGDVEVTWDVDLAHREILITSNSTYNSVTLSFTDKNNKRINHVGESSAYKTIASKSKVTTKVIVPKGAVKMNMSSYNTSLRVYEITAPSTMERPDTQKITSTETTNSVTLNWTRSSRAQIFKNGKKIGEVYNGTTYTDNKLFSNEQQNYEVLFINENGNAPLDFVEYSVKTESKEINFHSSHADGPLMFDDNLDTVTSGGDVEITWDVDLAHREILITSNSTYNSVTLSFTDKNNKRINHVGESSAYKTIASKSKVTTKVIVPEGAVKMNMSSYNTSLRVYEVQIN